MPQSRRAFLALSSLALSPTAAGSIRTAGALAQEQDPRREPTPAKTVILVRHGETEGDTKNVKDPLLSDAGKARAESLAELLSAAGVSHLFASEYLRTQRTLAPLAKRTKLDLQMISAREPKAQVAAIHALPAGSVAVIAGHSNTTPALVEALGGTFTRGPGHESGAPQIDHAQHGRLFLVFAPQPSGKAQGSLELRY